MYTIARVSEKIKFKILFLYSDDMNYRSLCRTVLALLLIPCGCSKQYHVSIAEQQKLESLGYINLLPVTAQNEHKVGVTKYDRRSAYNGLNLFNSRSDSIAKLMTMDGQEVYCWASDVKGETFKQYRKMLPLDMPPYLDGWNHIEMIEGGDLLVIGTHHMLLRLDEHSQIKWKIDISVHHDLSVAKNGDIYVLADGIRMAEVNGEPVAFQDNFVVVVTPDGKIKQKLSVFDALADNQWKQELQQRLSVIKPAKERRLESLRKDVRAGRQGKEETLRLYDSATKGDVRGDEGIMNILFHNRPEDIFHSNSIQVLKRANPGLWCEGDLLVCILKFDMIVVIDHESGRVIWTWGEGALEGPHHATYLPDGTVLIFDNGIRRKYSRIVKLDPRTREITWQYKADPPNSFYSGTRGGCQQLPNGNIIITETNDGRVFEVTCDGEIVWEYYNEVLKNVKGEKKRGAIYRMTRLDLSSVEQLLQ